MEPFCDKSGGDLSQNGSIKRYPPPVALTHAQVTIPQNAAPECC